MIKALYNSSTSAVLLNNIQGYILKTTVIVRHVLYYRLHSNIGIICIHCRYNEIQNNHVLSISIGGFSLSNLRFIDDISYRYNRWI